MSVRIEEERDILSHRETSTREYYSALKRGSLILPKPTKGDHKAAQHNLGSRHAKQQIQNNTPNLANITKPALRRLARRGGVKRISGLIYDEARQMLRQFIQEVTHDALTYAVHAKRKTIRPVDIVCALKRQGRTLYGYGV